MGEGGWAVLLCHVCPGGEGMGISGPRMLLPWSKEMLRCWPRSFHDPHLRLRSAHSTAPALHDPRLILTGEAKALEARAGTEGVWEKSLRAVPLTSFSHWPHRLDMVADKGGSEAQAWAPSPAGPLIPPLPGCSFPPDLTPPQCLGCRWMSSCL